MRAASTSISKRFFRYVFFFSTFSRLGHSPWAPACMSPVNNSISVPTPTCNECPWSSRNHRAKQRCCPDCRGQAPRTVAELITHTPQSASAMHEQLWVSFSFSHNSARFLCADSVGKCSLLRKTLLNAVYWLPVDCIACTPKTLIANSFAWLTISAIGTSPLAAHVRTRLMSRPYSRLPSPMFTSLAQIYASLPILTHSAGLGQTHVQKPCFDQRCGCCLVCLVHAHSFIRAPTSQGGGGEKKRPGPLASTPFSVSRIVSTA